MKSLCFFPAFLLLACDSPHTSPNSMRRVPPPAIRAAPQPRAIRVVPQTPTASASPPLGYFRADVWPASGRDGNRGRLELLVDARVPWEEVSNLDPEKLVGGDPCSPVTGGAPLRFCETLAPLRGAKLRFVNDHGEAINSLALDRPMAKVSPFTLYENGPSAFSVTVDLSAGWGSYSGPVTRFVEVHEGHLRYVPAVDSQGSAKPLRLAKTLKTAWRPVPSQTGAPDFLMVACRPVLAPSNAVKFRVTYSRMSFQKETWRRFDRSEPGFWEDEGEFPEESRFPSAH